jgi:hypothetical protein
MVRWQQNYAKFHSSSSLPYSRRLLALKLHPRFVAVDCQPVLPLPRVEKVLLLLQFWQDQALLEKCDVSEVVVRESSSVNVYVDVCKF